MNIKWSDFAINDLNDIYEFYAEKNLQVAAKLYNSIIDETEILKTYPYIASVEHIFEDFTETIRSLVICKGKFKVIYQVENNMIYVFHLWDCRQEPEKLRSYFK